MNKVHEYETQLYEKMKAENTELLARFEEGYFEDTDVKALENVLKEMQV